MEIHHPQPESWGHVNPIGERACYDEGKRSAETLFINYHKQNNVKIKIIRIFNTYGPKMHPNDARSFEFYCSGLQNQDITVYGQGNQTRSFMLMT
jgi:UDP-glucuronate decarboxylase